MQATLWYSIRLLALHPTISAEGLVAGMGRSSDFPGDKRGDGFFQWSMVNETRGERTFFLEVSDVLTWLDKRGDFVRSITSTGGSLEIFVQLAGQMNIGDSWSTADMTRAVDLGVSLGVEVFPNVRGVTYAL